MTDNLGFPLSPQQEHAWQSLGATAAPAYARLRVVGPIDVERVKAALERVVARHEILRTTFARVSGRRSPLQVIESDAAVAFAFENLTGDDGARQTDRIDAARAELNAVRRVDARPVLHARLFTLSSREHVLELGVPVFCADLETLRLVAVELVATYAGRDLGPEPVQYADYAEWQRQELQSDSAQAVAARSHWAGIADRAMPPAVLGLPTAALATFDVRSVRSLIAADEWSRIAALADRAGRSAEQVSLAACHALLARLSGAGHVCVRLVSQGRVATDLASACGPYARSLPVVLSVESDAAFEDVLERTERAVAEAIAAETYWPCEVSGHHEVHFEWGVRSTLAAADLVWSVEQLEAHNSRFALKLSCVATAQGLETTLLYDAGAISGADAERLSQQYRALVKSLGQATSRPISTLSLEAAGVAQAFARGTGAISPAVSVPAWIAEHARSAPAARAVVAADGVLSYGELMGRAAGVAAWLEASGVGPGSVVGVCGEPSTALLVALLGAWQAGAAYLPLGPDHPPARVTGQLTETAAAAVIATGTNMLSALSGYEGPLLVLDQTSLPAAAERPIAVSPDAAAYVLYTSGSTGRPKGVIVRHRNLVAYTAAIVATLRAAGIGGEGVQWASVSALTADLGNTSVFPALVSGGCLHLVSPAATLDPAAIGEYMAAAKMDVLKITPSHLAALLTETPQVLPRRALICGGEALSWELVEQVRQQGTCAVWNHYGPTETTVGALIYEVPATRGRTRTVPIGHPLGAATVAVVDTAGAIVPVGVPGELWIGGAGVSAGYIGQPTLTAERFVTPDWGDAAMYRTGDRVWMTSDGTVEFLGRVDDQVKIRGYRVEPAEIEHVLQTVAGVREGAVVAVGEVAEQRLVAYVVADAMVPDAAIRDSLGERLPDYMVPGTLVRVSALPRLENGKVDRRALATRAVVVDATSPAMGPRTPVEETLGRIWQTLLNRDAIGIHERFFEIGGHSLLATRLVVQVRRAFDVQLPLRAIFEHSTIARLAELVEARLRESASADELLADVEGLSDAEVQALLDEADKTS
jgi:amino acid adenylation domain-containing protein